MTDSQWMQRALALALCAKPISPPNPSVGCVIVRGQDLLGEGFTQETGSDHAEIQAIKDAQARGHTIEGATVYVTLEPCSHYGRTPPCALRLTQERVARVVVACQDPNPQVAGRGIAILKNAGIEVEVGVLEREAWQMNAGFMTRMTKGLPWVRAKVAMSADGFTALANGESQWITGAAAREDGHVYRSYASAILTGVGTVEADDCELTVRLKDGLAARQPLKVVVDSHLKIRPDAKIFKTGRVLVACIEAHEDKVKTLKALGAEVLVLPACDGRVDLEALLRELAARGANEVHVEAGATLNGALMQANLIDELVLYRGPKFLGFGRAAFKMQALEKLADASPWRVDSVVRIGGDTRTILIKGKEN